jgi:hypothetical protein
MSTWLERFALVILAAILVAAVSTNPWRLDRIQLGALVAAVVALSVFAARTIERLRSPKAETSVVAAPTEHKNSTPADGQGGRGGGGSAIGKNSTVFGGKGGKGGGPGGGRGGDGGGGDAVGDGSMVIGGDGGGGGRSDGRGGAGGPSPLKRLTQDQLKSWGLTGTEGYGQGGRGANSPEYDRSLRVLGTLSAEFAARYPNSQMTPMPGVLMPPIEWVNDRLSQMKENFRVELVDHGTDFLLRGTSSQ